MGIIRENLGTIILWDMALFCVTLLGLFTSWVSNANMLWWAIALLIEILVFVVCMAITMWPVIKYTIKKK